MAEILETCRLPVTQRGRHAARAGHGLPVFPYV